MSYFTFHLSALLTLTSPMLAQQTPAPANPASVLANIQGRMAQTLPLDSLLALSATLDHARTRTPNAYLSYWEAYTQYRLAGAYDKDRKGAEQAVNKGIQLLEDIKTKSSEHLALLSLLQGMQLEFVNTISLPFKAPVVAATARKAIELDPTNLRGYLALAIYDLHTPKLYGGGAIAEENLLKATTLPVKADPNTYAPDWGQGSAYWYLARFYQDAGKPTLAKQYAATGAAKFPTNRSLQSLNAKL